MTDAFTIGASGAASFDVAPPLDDGDPDDDVDSPFAPEDPDAPDDDDDEDDDGSVAFIVDGSSMADVPQATTTDPTSSTRTAVRTIEQLLYEPDAALELLL